MAAPIANADAGTLLRLLAVGLGASVLAALLQASLRDAIWSLWHLVATFFGVLARVTLTFVGFLSRLIAEAVDGLAEEGRSVGGVGTTRPWIGWLIVGPLVYCALLLTFMASDLTVAVLIFEAMGLTLGATARSTIPLPLDAAMGVVFVALAVFWGIVYFDLLGVTPFRYIWHALTDSQRDGLTGVVLACLCLTVLAGTTMGLWSQAQLRGGLPEPWQTALPWFIRGALVALLICATALSGKPFGSAVTAVFVLALLVVRGFAYVLLVLLRLVVALLRESLRVVLAVLALIACVGAGLWNWLATFDRVRRLHVLPLTATGELEAVGGDLSIPDVFV